MTNLLQYIDAQMALSPANSQLIKDHFTTCQVPAQTVLLEAGKTERYIYFISSGIVKGYQNIDGKIVVQHLVGERDFFTSLDSFMTQTPAPDYYETVTPCTLLKITKTQFDYLHSNTTFWADLVKNITNQHLSCKLERVKDFQTLTAKQRYLKFVQQHPQLALQVSIDNIASFLGMEPQSLSRIRKQIAF